MGKSWRVLAVVLVLASAGVAVLEVSPASTAGAAALNRSPARFEVSTLPSGKAANRIANGEGGARRVSPARTGAARLDSLVVRVRAWMPSYPYTGSDPGSVLTMGDSYSSGEGLGSSPEGGDCSDPNTETSTDKCHRSSYAYSAEVLPDQSHTFIACSGATIIDVTSKGQYGEGSQLGQIGNPSTVMLTLGGDDLDFTAGLGSCISAYPFETPLFGSQTGHSDGILGGQTNNCQGWINADEEVVSANGSQPSEMQSDLENTYEQILAKLSPTASLLVGNYPRSFRDVWLRQLHRSATLRPDRSVWLAQMKSASLRRR